MSEESRIEDRSLTEPIKLSSAFYGSALTATVQPDFPLCEADYLRLTSSGSSLKDWAANFFLATLGGALIIGGKFLARIKSNISDPNPTASGSNATIEEWEFWAVGIGFLIAFFLYLASLKLPSDKSRTLARMKDHFSSNPRQHHVMKARK